MNHSKLTIAAVVVSGLVVVACSGAEESTKIPDAPAVPSAPSTPKKGETDANEAAASPDATPPRGETAAEGGEDADDDDGGDGATGRVSVDGHCCYDGAYYACPNEAACFGGVDVPTCLAGCAPGNLACLEDCFDELEGAGAPKGCVTGKTPPPGVDCAKGRIDL